MSKQSDVQHAVLVSSSQFFCSDIFKNCNNTQEENAHTDTHTPQKKDGTVGCTCILGGVESTCTVSQDSIGWRYDEPSTH